MSRHSKTCKAFVELYLGRPWAVSDGLPERDIARAEARLGILLPSALRDFYRTVGAVDELCSAHNLVFHPRDLFFEDDYLLFMDENQSVVSWGIRRKDLKKSDPETMQLNNSSGKWFSEKKSFLELLESMFDWYREMGVWKR